MPGSFSIPFLSLSYQHEQTGLEIQKAITEVYNKNWFVLGERVESFEYEFAKYSGVPHCIGVGSGTDALIIALLSCNLQEGDEVIVPANTYIATWLAVSHTPATIVPVEPDESTFTIDVTKIEEQISPKTKVILPVHLFGLPCDMTTIDELARRFNIIVVEDNAQAHGAKWREKFTGSYGTINATSFYPTKNLGALGDGGAITTFDEDKAEFVRRYRNYGFAQKNVSVHLGGNSRLDEIQAAVLSIKLRYLDAWNEQRRQLASKYLESLQSVGDLILPLLHKEATHVYHLFVVRTNYRDKLKNYLQDHGIETMIHYPIPPHLQKAYSHLGYKKGDFPITERMAETMLSLPLWPGMTDEQIQYVIETIKIFFSNLRKQ